MSSIMLERSGSVKRFSPSIGKKMRYPFPRPQPPFCPKPKRFPERKAVTIALGFCSNEGVVLCADTQETLPGYTKEHTGKVVTNMYPGRFIVVMAGAGWTDYVRTAMQCVSDAITDDLKTIRDVSMAIKKSLLEFFDTHLLSWAHYPQSERPTVELLIGALTQSNHKRLFHYNGTAFHETDRQAIGSGVILANNLISDYSFGVESIDELVSIAVHIMSKVKNGVDGCGGYTHLVAIKPVMDWGLTEIEDIERVESDLEKAEEKSKADWSETVRGHKVPIFWMSEHKNRKSAKRIDSSSG